MITRALLSVSDKTGLIEFAKGLKDLGIEIISTGGTYQYLLQAGIQATSIETVTGVKEMLDGRVKTLHPAIHGGLLAKADNKKHQQDLLDNAIQLIDLVCVNLYPFKETILKPETSLTEAIEQIDIGGPSMLRSGAKNFQRVTVVVDPKDYPKVLEMIQKDPATTLAFRKKLAQKVFTHTASYDSLIAEYLTKDQTEPEFLPTYTKTYQLKQNLRYGENPQQKAAFYEEMLPPAYSLVNSQQLHGKELSYNNIKDADAALRIMAEFKETPAVVAVKHMNPCGVGLGENLEQAWLNCYEADPVSIFGGIVVFNKEVTLNISKKLHELFLEIIIAPSFSLEALEVLQKKKNLRILTLDFSQVATKSIETVSVLGGLLLQEQDSTPDDETNFQVVTKKQPTAAEYEALKFAFKVCKHVKSNAIVVANSHQTLGIGAGQMNRVGSVKIATEQAGQKAKGAVLASDAFFPMSDSVEYAAKKGITAIIQPGGSIKDQASIDACDALGIAMIFTKVRHFRH